MKKYSLITIISLAAFLGGELAHARKAKQNSGEFQVLQASFSVTDQRASKLYDVFLEAGATNFSLLPGSLAIDIPNLLIDLRLNSKDYLDKSDPCYERPAVNIKFESLQSLSQDPKDGTWVTINPNRECSGKESDQANRIMKALVAVGYNRVEEDMAMGGERAQSVTDLLVPNNAKDGALGTFGGELSVQPPETR